MFGSPLVVRSIFLPSFPLGLGCQGFLFFSFSIHPFVHRPVALSVHALPPPSTPTPVRPMLEGGTSLGWIGMGPCSSFPLSARLPAWSVKGGHGLRRHGCHAPPQGARQARQGRDGLTGLTGRPASRLCLGLPPLSSSRGPYTSCDV